jgi:uncharacterized YigZ family protein
VEGGVINGTACFFVSASKLAELCQRRTLFAFAPGIHAAIKFVYCLKDGFWMGYKTVRDFAFAEFTERKSVFIGQISPARTEEDALGFIRDIKEKQRGAAHNVYAYVLRGGVKRCSDDGEPQGTAGIQLLETIEREGLTDTVIVVTRYFGGILLGAGGLVRAYSRGAKIAVDSAEIAYMADCAVLRVEMDYSFYNIFLNIAGAYGHSILSSDFLDRVAVEIRLTQEDSRAFITEVREKSSGKIAPELLRKEFAGMAL